MTQPPASPLVAARVDSTTWYSGVGIAETVDMLVGGIRNGSWVDGTLGGVGSVAETAVWVLDPVGALVTAGFGWAVEHLQPLSDALDWLAGDPDQIAANAQTWRNVAIQHTDVVDLYARAVRNQITDWDGAAATAYRTHAGQTTELHLALAKASEGMAVIVQMTGSLVSLVRTLVRDLIGELVSILVARIPLWTLEAVGTLGIGAPYVEAQVTALAAKWGARITRLLKALTTSLRNLMPAVRKLDEIIETIAGLLRRGAPKAPTRSIGPFFSKVGPRTNREVLEHGPGTPMTIENVKNIAQRMGINLDDVEVTVISEADEIRYLDHMDACAYAPAETPGRQIRFGPASFADEDTLAATIAHEFEHVLQQRRGDHLRRPVSELEEEAYAIEGPALERFRGDLP